MPIVEKKPQCHHTRWSSRGACSAWDFVYCDETSFGEERGKELSQETL